jgi:hypothetical protein
MAWSDPGDFTSGQILTAAQMDAIRESMFFGQATFTNEAARDAAIPATGITLQEGMRAYLTAPTVPAATGATTIIPSGVTTVYNGSVWVCTTPVSAFNNASGTTTSASFTATLSGSPGTNLSATLVTGTTALVSIQAALANNTDGQGAHIGIAVSGAGTKAASVAETLYNGGPANRYVQAAATFIIDGLTAGTNTFTCQYRVGGAGTADFVYRRLTVQGVA